MERNEYNNKIDFRNLFSHPMVKEGLMCVIKKLQIDPQNVTPFYYGGIGILFLSDRFLIKLPSYPTRDPKDYWLLRHDIKKEGEILSYMSCSFLPKLVCYNPEGKFLVREYIEGNTLSSVCIGVDKNYREKLFFSLLKTVNVLFEEIHNNPKGNYVIRDLKPVNLVVPLNSESIYLIDVGSVRSEKNMLSNTLNAHRIGSGRWLFWSPEQLLENIFDLDRRSDYFSFGATAYYILTGKPPYSNLERDKNKVVLQYLHEYKTVIQSIYKCRKTYRIPDNYIELIIRCLNPIPEFRIFKI